jgi:glycosyltransferase involved in cell wall biosynthesis
MNRQQLLSRLGHHHAVLYSTGPRRRFQGTSEPVIRPRIIARDNVSIDLIPTWMGRTQRVATLNVLIMKHLARRWRRILAPSEGSFVGWSFHPRFWPLMTYVNPDWLIYHAYDLFHKQGEWTPQLAEYESRFLQRARLVIASSEPIAEYLRERGARSVLVVENGVDYEAFAQPDVLEQEPPDIAGVPHPRIGYVGALNRKVDFALLAELAAFHPDWHVVLIGAFGNLDAETTAAAERLRQMRNVHFLGFKNRHELPTYVSAMDVNLLAYRRAPHLWTDGIYPLKLHEYLASGRPVVGANLSTLRSFADVVSIADTSRDWEQAIAAAIADVSPASIKKRRDVARRNSWDARAAILLDYLTRLSSSGTHAHT